MKRTFILAIAALMLGGLGLAQSFNWEQARGSQIRVLLNQHPWTTAITPFLPEFERLTGIKVVVETFPEAQFRNKVLVELASGTGALDAFMLTPNQEGNLYLKSGWLEPLSSYISNPALTALGLTRPISFPPRSGRPASAVVWWVCPFSKKPPCSFTVRTCSRNTTLPCPKPLPN